MLIQNSIEFDKVFNKDLNIDSVLLSDLEVIKSYTGNSVDSSITISKDDLKPAIFYDGNIKDANYPLVEILDTNKTLSIENVIEFELRNVQAKKQVILNILSDEPVKRTITKVLGDMSDNTTSTTAILPYMTKAYIQANDDGTWLNVNKYLDISHKNNSNGSIVAKWYSAGETDPLGFEIFVDNISVYVFEYTSSLGTAGFKYATIPVNLNNKSQIRVRAFTTANVLGGSFFNNLMMGISVSYDIGPDLLTLEVLTDRSNLMGIGYGNSLASLGTPFVGKCVGSTNWVKYRIEEKSGVMSIYEDGVYIGRKTLSAMTPIGNIPVGNITFGGSLSIRSVNVEKLSSNTVLFMDGESLTDKLGKNTLTAVGNVTTTTNDKKFGLRALFFDGSGDYLTNPTSSNFDFGISDFTIESYIKLSNNTDNIHYRIISRGGYQTGLNDWYLAINPTTKKLSFGCGNNTNYKNIISPIIDDFIVTDWNHIAVCREAGVVKLFINGKLVSTNTISTSLTNTKALSIGTNTGTLGEYYNGFIDGLRITKGIARYSEDFTPSEELTCSFLSIPSTIQGDIKNIKLYDSLKTKYSIFANIGSIVKSKISVQGASTDFKLNYMTPNELGVIQDTDYYSTSSIDLEAINDFDTITVEYKDGFVVDRLTLNGNIISIDDSPRELMYSILGNSVNLKSIVREYEIKFTSTTNTSFIEVYHDSLRVKLPTTLISGTTYTTGIVEVNELVNTLSIITAVTNSLILTYGNEKRSYNYPTVKAFFEESLNMKNVHSIKYNDGTFMSHSDLSLLLAYAKLPFITKNITPNKNFFGDYYNFYSATSLLNSISGGTASTTKVVDINYLNSKRDMHFECVIRDGEAHSNSTDGGTETTSTVYGVFTFSDNTTQVVYLQSGKVLESTEGQATKYYKHLIFTKDVTACTIYLQAVDSSGSSSSWSCSYVGLTSSDLSVISKFTLNTKAINWIKEYRTIGDL